MNRATQELDRHHVVGGTVLLTMLGLALEWVIILGLTGMVVADPTIMGWQFSGICLTAALLALVGLTLEMWTREEIYKKLANMSLAVLAGSMVLRLIMGSPINLF